jgi:ribose transport system permease protein
MKPPLRANLLGTAKNLPSRPRPRALALKGWSLRGRAAATFRQMPMLPVIILLAIVFSFTIDGFCSLANAQNVMRQLAVIIIGVTSETLVLLIGGIDLSVGAIIGLSSICGAYAMHATGSPLVGVVICVLVGTFVGTLNGLGIALGQMQPFIMTFGMMLTARAVAFLLTSGRSMGGIPRSLLQSGRATVSGIPLVFIIALAVAVAVGLILRRTVFGQRVYLTGANGRAAAFSGVDVRRVTFLVYTFAGGLAGFAGLMFIMRLGAATPTAGDPLLLEIIGAAVLGGTALTGGEGGISRSLSGCVLIVMLDNCLEILGAEFWDQMIVIGALIAAGSALGSWLSRRRQVQGRRVRDDGGIRSGSSEPLRDPGNQP